MTDSTIHFDNAATTHPKPEMVYRAADQYLRYLGGADRANYRQGMQSDDELFETRRKLARMLGVTRSERLIFTPGCTYSINAALKGFPFEQGDVVVVSALEHNAVMRCLRQLELSKGIQVEVLPYAARGIIDLHAFIRLMLDCHPRLIVVSEGSNVTGEIIDLRSVAAICGAHKVPLMVDAAQTAGHLPTNLEQLGISLWSASGHKGLFGPKGVGILYVSPSIDLEPLVGGSTDPQSESLDMPAFYPDRLEVGTLPGPAIAGLGAGIDFLVETGIENIRQHELALTQRFLDWALSNSAMRVYGNRHNEAGLAILSFAVDSLSCHQVALLLDQEFGMAVNAGLHCAAAAHKTLGTLDTGLVRASFSYFNTLDEVDALCDALQTMIECRDAGVLQAPAEEQSA